MSDYFLCHKLVIILSGAKRSRRIPLKLPSRFRRGMSRLCSTSPLGLASFHLPIFQFDGRSATKDGDRNPQLAPFRVNFFNNTVLVLEGSISNLDRFADFKRDLGLHLFLPFLHLGEHRFDLRLSHWDRLVFGAGKTNYSRRILDEIPGTIDQLIVLIE